MNWCLKHFAIGFIRFPITSNISKFNIVKQKLNLFYIVSIFACNPYEIISGLGHGLLVRIAQWTHGAVLWFGSMSLALRKKILKGAEN